MFKSCLKFENYYEKHITFLFSYQLQFSKNKFQHGFRFDLSILKEVPPVEITEDFRKVYVFEIKGMVKDRLGIMYFRTDAI